MKPTNSKNSHEINLLSIEETANILRVAPQTIRNWIAQRRFPHMRIGRANLISKKQLISWLEKKEVKTWE